MTEIKLPKKAAQRQKKKLAKKRQSQQAQPYSQKHIRQKELKLASSKRK